MNIYLIVSVPDFKLTPTQQKLLDTAGTTKIIYHKGKIGAIDALKNDPADKVLAIDPDVVDWDLDVEAFDAIKNVKAICTQSTSFGWVKPEVLEKKGIKIFNVPGFSTDSVAEYAIGLAIESARRLPLQLKTMSLDWSTKPMLLKGKTLGIIGLGKIGHRIAEIGKGIGMKVIYWSPHTRDEQFSYQELSDVFSHADVLIPALKDTEETKTLITHAHIDTLKPSSIVIGINRIKDLFDEKYVISRVEQGKIAGYAFEGDNVKEITSPANVWGVPPIAWYTKDSLENLIEGWVKNVVVAARE